MNGRQYRCQATNASGTTYSATVTLTVKKGPDYVPPALKPITERVIHLPAPKTGGKMYYVFPQENDQYGAIFSWNRSVDPEEGFEPGLDYVLYLDLSAKNGYTLDGLTPDFFLVPGAEKVELSEEFGRPPPDHHLAHHLRGTHLPYLFGYRGALRGGSPRHHQSFR